MTKLMSLSALQGSTAVFVFDLLRVGVLKLRNVGRGETAVVDILRANGRHDLAQARMQWID